MAGQSLTLLRDWLEKNGKKLMQNAVNLEYACKVLDGLGLRTKLARVRDAMTRPSVVLPTPGGPQRIIEGRRSVSMACTRGLPGPKRCPWPT